MEESNSVGKFWIFGHFNFLTWHSVIRVELDSSQCDTARSPTQRSFTIFRKNKFFCEIFFFSLFIRDPDGSNSWRKKMQKSRDTASLSCRLKISDFYVQTERIVLVTNYR